MRCKLHKNDLLADKCSQLLNLFWKKKVKSINDAVFRFKWFFSILPSSAQNHYS